MSKQLIIIVIILALVGFCLFFGTERGTSFNIQFIDVGQGDSALVECDGHYMLIDGGAVHAGEKVYDVLESQGIRKLDILAISHLHSDHYGGLTKALMYATDIGVTISNSRYSDAEGFRDFEHRLGINGSKITVPNKGQKYKLGSSTVEVIDVCNEKNNDSLVLLITYKKTRFLFTGDIERSGQLRVYEALHEDSKHSFSKRNKWVSLIKMPHHGAYNDEFGISENALYKLLWEYDPSYFIISVGENNPHGHPHQETLDEISNLLIKSKELDWESHVFRTDKNGDVFVKSSGTEIFIKSFI